MGKTQFLFILQINIENTVVPLIEAELAKDGNKPYFRAAMFYFENNLDINRAAELMKKALGTNTWPYCHVISV